MIRWVRQQIRKLRIALVRASVDDLLAEARDANERAIAKSQMLRELANQLGFATPHEVDDEDIWRAVKDSMSHRDGRAYLCQVAISAGLTVQSHWADAVLTARLAGHVAALSQRAEVAERACRFIYTMTTRRPIAPEMGLTVEEVIAAVAESTGITAKS